MLDFVNSYSTKNSLWYIKIFSNNLVVFYIKLLIYSISIITPSPMKTYLIELSKYEIILTINPCN
jgi:hypothetical protein